MSTLQIGHSMDSSTSSCSNANASAGVVDINSFPGKSFLARHQLLARFTNYVGLSSK